MHNLFTTRTLEARKKAPLSDPGTISSWVKDCRETNCCQRLPSSVRAPWLWSLNHDMSGDWSGNWWIFGILHREPRSWDAMQSMSEDACFLQALRSCNHKLYYKWKSRLS